MLRRTSVKAKNEPSTCQTGERRPLRRKLGTLPGRLMTVLVLIATMMAAQLGGANPAAAAEVREIVLPIAPSHVDKVYWTDTYGACRSGCSRSHVGVDIMGPKMVPLLAAADGVVSWMRHDTSRGNNLDITDAEGWTYHYVHINNDTPGTDDGANAFEFAFAPGIERGASVKAGQVVAYLGDSGNAESTGSHLHFEITRPDGSNINPTPSVDAAKERLLAGSGVTLADLDAATQEELAGLVDELSEALVGRELSSVEKSTLVDQVINEGLGATLEQWVDEDSRVAAVDRLYQAFFLRMADSAGLRYWLEQAASGAKLQDLADVFASSDEYQIRYPDMTFDEFLDQLYLEVLDRDPDEAGKAYWLDELKAGRVTRGTIVVQFTESIELKSLTRFQSEVTALTNLFEQRSPTEVEVAAWAELRASTSLADAIDATFGEAIAAVLAELAAA